MTILGTYKGRHRKPNRRGRWMRRGAALSWAALVTLGLARLHRPGRHGGALGKGRCCDNGREVLGGESGRAGSDDQRASLPGLGQVVTTARLTGKSSNEREAPSHERHDGTQDPEPG